MNKKQLLVYYTILLLLLTAVFFQNIALRMAMNSLFPIVSIIFYFYSRKNNFNSKDQYYVASLCAASIQEIFTVWRHQQWGINWGIFFLFLMFFFFIQTIKQEEQYLLFGKNKLFIKAAIIILAAVCFFASIFLPFIPDYFIIPLFVHTFSMFFSFLVALNRRTNHQSYILVILGMVLFVFTTLFASVSLFIIDFPLSYFFERLSFLLGTSFITIGIIKSYSA
ncbi:hypothetical protein EMA8858_01820 [Emticicia aquatica]|jgi:hypothetical protein|uniref:Uncharacterized protein n=1 Tax=Emticicia aquatica TaxID=1681835 RepID=A0ABM9AQZ1_9BACT|nr:hypothetical protein [Emticicia aquatica]CAH0995695.1 hypothetical protein EMA8858_01820 [Emticicia aquatica]